MVPPPGDLILSALGAGFAFLEAGAALTWLLFSFTLFFVLLTFFTVNSSSSLSAGSLKSLSDSGKGTSCHFTDTRREAEDKQSGGEDNLGTL